MPRHSAEGHPHYGSFPPLNFHHSSSGTGRSRYFRSLLLGVGCSCGLTSCQVGDHLKLTVGWTWCQNCPESLPLDSEVSRTPKFDYCSFFGDKFSKPKNKRNKNDPIRSPSYLLLVFYCELCTSLYLGSRRGLHMPFHGQVPLGQVLS